MTVSELTAMPGPKVAVVVLLMKCVNRPTIVTFVIIWPCDPELGVRLKMDGGVPFTVNPLARIATSPPVVSVTLWVPTGALSWMVKLTVALVALLTLTLPTVIPEPKSAVVVPLVKCVELPITVTTRTCP